MTLRHLLAAAALGAVLAPAPLADAQTGPVWNQACNGGSGGFVGQMYGGVLCTASGGTQQTPPPTTTPTTPTPSGPQTLLNQTGVVTMTVTSTSANIALPSADQVVMVTNTGPQTVYVALGTSGISVVAQGGTTVTSGQSVQLVAGVASYLAAVTGAGTSTLTIQTGVLTAAAGPTRAASTNGSATVTTAGTFQTLLAANTSRRGCLVQNTSTDTLDVYVGATASATHATSFHLSPNQTFSCSAGLVVVTDNLAITAETTSGATFILESQ